MFSGTREEIGGRRDLNKSSRVGSSSVAFHI